jgi:hypothetical protein
MDSAALLVDKILPHQPIRQWVLSVPFPLRFLDGVYIDNKHGSGCRAYYRTGQPCRVA